MTFTACCLIAALHATVPDLPPSAFADTEASTNLPFVVDLDRVNTVTFRLELNETPSNSVEVALGCDRNGDGNLSVEEADLVFGYDCGRWFRRVTKGDLLVPAEAGSLVRLAGKGEITAGWNLAKVTRRGLCASGVRVELRAVRRGAVFFLR